MTYLSILEKLKILFNMILNYKVVLVFTLLIIILSIFYMIRKISTKKYTILMTISFILMFTISIISNQKVLSDTFDNFTTIFFGSIYFPSIYVYISTLVIILMSFAVSILNKKMKKSYKIINSVSFMLNNILLVIILNIIAKNKIDVFSVSSLYTNTNLVVILEISMSLFIIWFLSIVATFATNGICDRIKVVKPVKKIVEEPVNTDIINTTNLVSSVEYRETASTNNVVEEPAYANERINDNKLDVVIENNKTTFEDILYGKIPVFYCESKVNNIDYNIVDPQKIIEEKYVNKIKDNKVSLQDMISNLSVDNSNIELEAKTKAPIIENASNKKQEVVNERLKINSISLDKLSDKESNIIHTKSINDIIKEENIKTYNTVIIGKDDIDEDISLDNFEDCKNNNYTVEDYKKFVKMLKQLKIHFRGNNVKIDDAIAISLISNYSYDDCIKFKSLLESNLNNV